MQLVALRDWYPRFGDWTGTTVLSADRVGWLIHHTVGGTGQDPEAYARGVADYHYGKWGVPGGYNYLVGEDGLIRVMCGFSFAGVHSGTHEWNYKSLGLAFQGDFRNRPPSELMLAAARELIADTPIPADQWGHRDVRPKPTTCPGGELYDLLPLVKEDHMFIAAKGTDAHKDHGWPDTGPVVEYYQHLFRRLDPSYDPSVGGWGNANSPEFAAELRKYSPGDTVIGPGERAALEILIAERFGVGVGAHDHDGRYVRDVTVER